MTACAEIAESDGVEYVYNAIEVTEDSYDFLKDIWPSVANGRRLQWISELEPAPGFDRPVWRDWTKQNDGWHPPGDIQRAD